MTESGIRDTGRRTTTGIVAGVIEAGKAEGMTDTAAIADTTSVDTLGIDDTNEKREWFSNKKGENGKPKHYVLSWIPSGKAEKSVRFRDQRNYFLNVTLNTSIATTS